MRLLKKVTAIFDHTNDLLSYFACVLLYFIMFGVLSTIILRLLGTSLVWMFESLKFALVWITFLGAAWLLKREGHVKMELLLSRLNPRNRGLLISITSVIAAISCLVIAWYGAMMTWDYYQIGFTTRSTWRPLVAPIMVIIPVGSFLFFIQFLRRAYGNLGEWRASADKEKGQP